MNLKVKLLLVASFTFCFSTAQTNTFPSSGNVGIGTTSPGAKLHLVSSGGQNSGMNLEITSASSYGTIDFVTPSGLLGQFITTGSSFNNGIFTGNQTAFANYATNGSIALVGGGTGSIIKFATNGYEAGNERMRLSATGTLGIGTTSPNANAKLDVNGNIFSSGKIAIGTTDTSKIGTHSLAVNGSAIFTKAIVKLNANWPDYVFKKDYKLSSLEEIDDYLKNNQHLPDIPSAEEVAKNGIDLGDNQALLLKKIEELTLLLIQQNKKLNSQNSKIKFLEKQVRNIKKLKT